MKTIRNLDIKYAMLDARLSEVYVGKVLKDDDLTMLKNRVRLTNALVTPIEADDSVDPYYEFALVFFRIDWVDPYEFIERFFSPEAVESFLSKCYDELVYENGVLKYGWNKSESELNRIQLTY